MKDEQIVSLIEKKIQSEIQKYNQKMKEIFSDNIKTIDEKLAEVETLIQDYYEKQNDETSRNEQIQHKNNDAPLGRNRVIVEAELKQHLMQFQENWENNTDHAEGKYTSKKHEEWDKKLQELQEELKNSPV